MQKQVTLMLTLDTDEILKNTQHVASNLDVTQKTLYVSKICILFVCHHMTVLTGIQGTPRGVFHFLKLS